MTNTNKERFTITYAACFKKAYPQFDISRSEVLIEKAMTTALQNIRLVNIDGVAFKATCKELGIKHSYSAIERYLTATE